VCDGIDKCPNTPAGAKVDASGCPEGQAMAMSQPPPEAPKPQPPVEKAAPPPAPEPVKEQPRETRLDENHSVKLENVHFDSGSSNLTSDSDEQLEEVVRAMERYPDARIEIQGHTDSQGAAAANMKLSQARANAVRQWLIERGHIDASRVVAKGYGETKLEVSPEQNADDRKANRRVVLRVLNPESLKGAKVEH